jgi:hypothetical protein
MDMMPEMLNVPAGYIPSCDPNTATAVAQYWYVDVPEVAPHTDLVVDVADTIIAYQTGLLDSVIDISTMCSAQTSLACGNTTTQGGGDLAIVPDIVAGRYYVAIANGSGARAADTNYQMRIFTRPVIPVGTPCDFHMEANRCENGSYCLDSGNGAGTVCTAMTPRGEGQDKGCPTTMETITQDTVITGSVTSTDFDYFAIRVPSDMTLRAMIYSDPNGGCSGDLAVGLATDQGGSCSGTFIGGDDNGIGSCGWFEDANPLDHTQTYYLEIRVAEQNVTDPRPYVVVLDFGY